MRIPYLLSILLAVEFLAFGQLDTGTLTITAARTQALLPDQATFNVSVGSKLDSGLDQILAALSGTGITAADLSSVSGSSLIPVLGILPITTAAVHDLQWYFTVSVPLSRMGSLAATLTALQKTIGQNKSGLDLTFDLVSIQVSQEARQSHPCSFSDLVADARAQAQRLADAAGVGVGPVLSLSDGGTSATFAVAPATRPIYRLSPVSLVNERVGVPAIAFFNVGLLTTARPAPTGCSMVVKFKMLPSQ